MASWGPAHSGKLRVRSWCDDEFNIVFDAASGDTHLLDDLSLRLLELVNQQRCSTTVLAEQVSEFFADGLHQDQSAFVEKTLLQLQATGLVVCNAP
jgi:PqqD family protein of HPr-rel-A system